VAISLALFAFNVRDIRFLNRTTLLAVAILVALLAIVVLGLLLPPRLYL